MNVTRVLQASMAWRFQVSIYFWRQDSHYRTGSILFLIFFVVDLRSGRLGL